MTAKHILLAMTALGLASPLALASGEWKQKATEADLETCFYAVSRLGDDQCQGYPSERTMTASGGYCDELACLKPGAQKTWTKKERLVAVEASSAGKGSLCVYFQGEVHPFPISKGSNPGGLKQDSSGTYGLNLQGIKQSCDREFVSLRYGTKPAGDKRIFDATLHPGSIWMNEYNSNRLSGRTIEDQKALSQQNLRSMGKPGNLFLTRSDAFSERASKNRISEETSPAIRQACQGAMVQAIQERAAAIQKIVLTNSDGQAYASQLLNRCGGVDERFSQVLLRAFPKLAPKAGASAPAAEGASSPTH